MTTTGRRSWISLHVIERPATSRLPIVSKYPGAKLLNRRSGGTSPAGTGAPSTSIGLPLSSPSIVMEDERPTDVTPGT